MSEQSEILQILRDCGLSDSPIERFLTDGSADPDRRIRFLRLYRPERIRSLRRAQKQVDSLDFLVHRLETKKRERKERNHERCTADTDPRMGQDFSQKRKGFSPEGHLP